MTIPLNSFMGQALFISCICKHRKIMIPKQIQQTLYNDATVYFATQVKLGPNEILVSTSTGKVYEIQHTIFVLNVVNISF